MGHCGLLWDIMGYYGTLWNIVGHCDLLWDIVGYYGTLRCIRGTLWGILGHCGIMWKYPLVWMSSCLDVQLFGRPIFWISSCLDYQLSGCPAVRIASCLDCQLSGWQVAPTGGKRGCRSRLRPGGDWRLVDDHLRLHIAGKHETKSMILADRKSPSPSFSPLSISSSPSRPPSDSLSHTFVLSYSTLSPCDFGSGIYQ